MKSILAFTLGIFLLAGCSEEGAFEVLDSGNAVEVVDDVKEVEPIIDLVTTMETKTTIALSQEELDYLKYLNKSTEIYDLKMTEIRNLLNNYEESSEQWLQELRGNFMAVAMMNAPSMEMVNTNVVPVRFEETHQNLMKTFYTMTLAGEKIVEGATGEINQTLLDEGVALIIESNSYLSEVLNDVKELSAENHVD